MAEAAETAFWPSFPPHFHLSPRFAEFLLPASAGFCYEASRRQSPGAFRLWLPSLC